MHIIGATLAVLLLATAAFAQTATVIKSAPIYVQKDPPSSLSPLRVAAAGTVLTVVGEEGEWVQVQFQDPQWGLRTGWVRSELVSIRRPELEPMDLSVKPQQPPPPSKSATEAPVNERPSSEKLLHDQRVVSEMTPELIAEAIKAGENGRVPDGEMTKSSGWSWGSIHIATFSTPYMRVAMAARQAKKTYRKFTPADVTPDLIAPELHVYGWSQMNGVNQPTQAPTIPGSHVPPATLTDREALGAVNVTAIVITSRNGKQEEKMATAIHPIRIERMPARWQNLLGASFDAMGMVAVFPLSALSEDNEIHVIYDRPATMGINAFGGRHCEDCSAPFKLGGVR